MKIGFITSTARFNASDSPQVKVSDLYKRSPLFKYQLGYSLRHYDKTFVLSAKHFIVGLDEFVEPFDRSLDSLSKRDFVDWQKQVANAIFDIFPEDTEFYFLAGRKYRSVIKLLKKKYVCHVPMKGMGIGTQLQFYKRELL